MFRENATLARVSLSIANVGVYPARYPGTTESEVTEMEGATSISPRGTLPTFDELLRSPAVLVERDYWLCKLAVLRVKPEFG